LHGESRRRARPAQAGVFARVDVQLGPPVPDPDKIICLGLNYRDHAEEAGLSLPTVPLLFAKFRNSLVGPEDEIALPAISNEIDYEAELALVVGAPAKDVPAERALDHVAGVMAFNDLSARDLQHQTSQWMAGKALDGFGPCGPALVTLDEIGDPQALRLQTRVNGRTVQDGSTADMIFTIPETLAHVSRLMTLESGDIICTGTPAGVGFKRDPQLLLTDGDVVEVELEGVGVLRNRMLAPSEDATAARRAWSRA
jgi:2-keto-4-pentenoate hydratase/2-oxohepta-3-ene-1,7-dioic acid hydratase in catechol pathway